MRDKEGFLIPCKYTEWKIIDTQDNKDFVCTKFPTYNYSAHLCHADEMCRYYVPDVRGEENEE